jgi:hydrogenase/urease accessory protein HupE
MIGFRRRLATAAMLALLLSSPAFAHPGHGRDGGAWSALHYLIEPGHVLFAVPMLVLAALAGGYLIRTRGLRQRPLGVKEPSRG